MITTIKLISTSITSHSYHCVHVCGEILSVSKFQVYNTVLLAIITMLYIKFPELIHLTQAYLGDIVGSVPKHYNKAIITIK